MITLSKLQFFLSKLFLYPQTHGFCYLIASELASASLSWQRLQLVLCYINCYINNFYGKVSSVDGQLLVSNIIDIVRFLEEL